MYCSSLMIFCDSLEFASLRKSKKCSPSFKSSWQSWRANLVQRLVFWEQTRSKLDQKAKKCIFVGYVKQMKGWICMDHLKHKFVVSRDVRLGEVSSYYEESSQIEQESGNSSYKKSTYLLLSPMVEVDSREVRGEMRSSLPQEHNHG